MLLMDFLISPEELNEPLTNVYGLLREISLCSCMYVSEFVLSSKEVIMNCNIGDYVLVPNSDLLCGEGCRPVCMLELRPSESVFSARNGADISVLICGGKGFVCWIVFFS